MKKTTMLKKNYEFKRILTKGTYYSGKYIEAFLIRHTEKQNKLGLAISVKIGKAVKRNHIKRLVRESYYELESELADGFSVVFLWKKKISVQEATFSRIKTDMSTIFHQAKIM